MYPSHLYQSPTYNTWHSMKQRCQNPRNDRFYAYGARGITVCERWQSFEGFLSDMGIRPEGHTLDRIDNARGYEPSNCRWATPAQQYRNMRLLTWLTFAGETLTLSEWSQRTGINRDTLRNRIRRGWPADRILNPALYNRGWRLRPNPSFAEPSERRLA